MCSKQLRTGLQLLEASGSPRPLTLRGRARRATRDVLPLRVVIVWKEEKEGRRGGFCQNLLAVFALTKFASLAAVRERGGLERKPARSQVGRVWLLNWGQQNQQLQHSQALFAGSRAANSQRSLFCTYHIEKGSGGTSGLPLPAAAWVGGSPLWLRPILRPRAKLAPGSSW